MIRGYARVSTDGQDLATQHELLKAAGAKAVYSEKQSGIKTDRAALARCMRSLEPWDTTVVTKLDRLAGSTRDLLNTLATIGEAGARFKSLGDLGGHYHSTWKVDAHGAGRVGRVRASLNPEPHQRRAGPGQGSWRSVRKEAQAH